MSCSCQVSIHSVSFPGGWYYTTPKNEVDALYDIPGGPGTSLYTLMNRCSQWSVQPSNLQRNDRLQSGVPLYWNVLEAVLPQIMTYYQPKCLKSFPIGPPLIMTLSAAPCMSPLKRLPYIYERTVLDAAWHIYQLSCLTFLRKLPSETP